jgi:CubicO group peptidase (beta-lactamase class C family)
MARIIDLKLPWRHRSRNWKAYPVAAAILSFSILLLTARNAAAADTQILRIEKAFEEWISRYSVTNASLVIARHGSIVGKVSHGTEGPHKPAPVASLSKAITGICIAKLVEAGRLQYKTQLGLVLKDYFANHPPRDNRVRSITIRHLLTHTSGITNDPSQGAALEEFRPFTESSMDKQFDRTLSALLSQKPGDKWTYNNMNYVALGVVIETLTAETYERYCGREVLEAVGVNGATINPDWRVMGAYGGWKISAEGYTRFLDYFDPSKKLLQSRPADWPKAIVGNGAMYSMGTYMRKAGSGYNFWHVGSWERHQPNASFGAFYAKWHQGISVVATYEPTASDAASYDLDSSLYRAAFR